MKPIAFANALTAVSVIAYLVCAALVYTVPDFVFSITQSWFHGWNLEAVKAASPAPLTSVVFGAISFGVFIWVLSYFFGRLYLYWTKNT